MPVQYQPIPQLQFPDLNILGAYAQGQALSTNRLREQVLEQQLAENARQQQEENAIRQYYMRPGMDPFSRQSLAGLATVSPTTFAKFMTPYAGLWAEGAREKLMAGQQSRAEELQPYEIKKAAAGVREEQAKATTEEQKNLIAGLNNVYMQGGKGYDAFYRKVQATGGPLADILGPTYDESVMERAVSAAPDILKERVKPQVAEPGKGIYQTGRPGEAPIYQEPQFVPNALATNQPALSTMAAQGRMQPIANEMIAPQVDPIIAKALRKDAMLRQLPPGPARETAGARLDLRDTLDEFKTTLGSLAEAGGIPQAGASNASNWKAAFRKSPTGQAIGGLSDSETNARLAALRSLAGVFKAQIRKGLEMGITQMDAVKESEKLDAAFLNPDKIKGLSEGYASVEALRKLLGGEAAAPATRGKVGGETKPLGGPIDFGDLK